MNQPPPADSGLGALADAFDNVLQSLGTPEPAPHHLSGPLTTLVDLTAHLGAQVHEAYSALATGAPADQSSYAATATELCHAIGAAGQAVNALATAQDAHLFIDYFADRYGHPDVNTAFAHTRITAALTRARDNLTETSGYLRRVKPVEPTGKLLRAALARSSQADTTAMGRAAVSPAESSTPIPPHPAARRR